MPVAPELSRPALPALRISATGRRIEKENGQPLFLLADTAWLLFHRANRSDVGKYLADRAAKGFNVIQAAVVVEANGAPTSNVFGESPFRDPDFARPNESYFDYVDWVVDIAASQGLYVAMAPMWSEADRVSTVFTAASALVFGEWLGRRYKSRSVLWVLEGACSRKAKQDRSIVHALAKGLRQGDAGASLVCCSSSVAEASDCRQKGDWLEASGRGFAENAASAPVSTSRTRKHSSSRPERPVIELDPAYEDNPIKGPEGVRYSDAADVRSAFYRSVFRGASGHCYGHPSIWRFSEGEPLAAGDAPMDWKEAMLQPGAFHAGIGRRLVESRPMDDPQPDDSILVALAHLPSDAGSRPAAMRDARGSWAMVYVPEGRPCAVRLDCLSAASIKVWRYDPRTGAATGLGVYPACGTQRFAPPVRGERLDWILVLDDAALERSAPGLETQNR